MGAGAPVAAYRRCPDICWRFSLLSQFIRSDKLSSIPTNPMFPIPPGSTPAWIEARGTASERLSYGGVCAIFASDKPQMTSHNLSHARCAGSRDPNSQLRAGRGSLPECRAHRAD